MSRVAIFAISLAAASAEGAGGRLWVVWDEGRRYWAQRMTPTGAADGAARPIATPPAPNNDLLRLDDLEIVTRGGGLDLFVGWQRADTPASGRRWRENKTWTSRSRSDGTGS